jgi:hypothetical protein
MKKFLALLAVVLFAVAPTVQVFAHEAAPLELATPTSANDMALTALANGQTTLPADQASLPQPVRVELAWCFPCYQIIILPPCNPWGLPICRPPY